MRSLIALTLTLTLLPAVAHAQGFCSLNADCGWSLVDDR